MMQGRRSPTGVSSPRRARLPLPVNSGDARMSSTVRSWDRSQIGRSAPTISSGREGRAAPSLYHQPFPFCLRRKGFFDRRDMNENVGVPPRTRVAAAGSYIMFHAAREEHAATHQCYIYGSQALRPFPSAWKPAHEVLCGFSETPEAVQLDSSVSRPHLTHS